VLKARVTDTNKAVQTLALDIVCRISTGMGKPLEKHARLFVLPVCTVLADQKAPIRSAALQALTAIATACNGLESMVPGFTTALETSNPLQKGTLLHWLVDWFKDKEPTSALELNTWVSPIISCLDDRNSDVRKGAQLLLPTLIAYAGIDHVLQQTNSLKPASRASAVPLIQAARPSAPASRPAPVTTLPSVDPIDRLPESSPVPSVPPPIAKTIGVRRKLPQGSSRLDSRADTPVETSKVSIKSPLENHQRAGGGTLPTQPSTSISLPFYGTNTDARKARTGKDSNRWINEAGPTRKDLADLLQSQMETHASKELIAHLFSHDHNAVNDHVQGLNTISEVFSGAEDENAEVVCLANFDLALKYVSIKAHEPQPNLISKCLEVVETVLAFLRNANYQLTDGEATCFIPTIIYKAIII